MPGPRPDATAMAAAVRDGTTTAEELVVAAFERIDARDGEVNAFTVVLREEALTDRARDAGARFVAGLREIQQRHPVIGDVRGRGLMIGIELVRDAARTPAPDLAKKLELEVLKRGALISTTGAHGNVLRITPPLVIAPEQVEQALAIIAEAVAALGA